MYFVSTRDKNGKKYTASEAMLKGLADNGGLFVPEEIPALGDINIENGFSSAMYQAIRPYFVGDELEDELEDICNNAFNFPIGFHVRKEEKEVMELFYGPTSAFKDYGARFLAFCLERLLKKRGEELCILVATSGDTGGAVASAFHKRDNLSVKVLFPKGRVTRRQEAQLTSWGNNVEAFEVDGSFDDCQKMVKEAFRDPELSGLSSANSINLGRLLPQMAYYVYASILFKDKYNKEATFVIPSGNVGNSTGAFWAKLMGAPIKRIVLAVNANKTIPDFLRTGEYIPRSSVRTLANAMDVGAPSNIERLFDLYPDFDEFKENVQAYSVSDEEIKDSILDAFESENYIICPHTACAYHVENEILKDEPTIIVSTAHPAKFETIVEPLIGKVIAEPENLFSLRTKPKSKVEIDKDYHKLFN